MTMLDRRPGRTSLTVRREELELLLIGSTRRDSDPRSAVRKLRVEPLNRFLVLVDMDWSDLAAVLLLEQLGSKMLLDDDVEERLS